VQTRPFFFTNSKFGPKKKRPELALEARRSPRSGERPREAGDRWGRRTPDDLRAQAHGAKARWLFFFLDRIGSGTCTMDQAIESLDVPRASTDAAVRS
jgi:hypothetical protein